MLKIHQKYFRSLPKSELKKIKSLIPWQAISESVMDNLTIHHFADFLNWDLVFWNNLFRTSELETSVNYALHMAYGHLAKNVVVRNNYYYVFDPYDYRARNLIPPEEDSRLKAPSIKLKTGEGLYLRADRPNAKTNDPGLKDLSNIVNYTEKHYYEKVSFKEMTFNTGPEDNSFLWNQEYSGRFYAQY